MVGANSFGTRFILTSFGESHGPALGAVLDGVPAGVKWDETLLRKELERRRPGQSQIVSARGEKDEAEVLSGVFEGKTLGTPIAVMVRNQDARSDDYKQIAKKPRAGHADDVWRLKFGHSDPRGGGRSSGRETVSRVISGSVAQMILKTCAPKLRVTGFASQIGPFELNEKDLKALSRSRSRYPADDFVARFPSLTQEEAVEKTLLDAKAEGHSYGGVAEIWVDGVPAGLGQPVFHKIKADLASACLSLGATSAFELGAGFAATRAEGSQFHVAKGDVYGGVRGGITTGERLVFRVAFKPTSSVLDVAKKGRHDPCIVPRALPVLEAMTYHVLADHLLWTRTDQI
jgi:chorismate synthase